jgi:hypothetical protein
VIKVLLGGVIGGVVMFLVGFIVWASPLNSIGYSTLDATQSANVQVALAANLPHTGYYLFPNPGTSGGTTLYGKGPVGTINYNSSGFSAQGGPAMLGGLIHEVVVALLIGFSLFGVAGRVTDFASRAKLVIGFSAAACVLLALSDPIWMHGDWRFAIYGLFANAAMLIVPGLVIARWFVPVRPDATLH